MNSKTITLDVREDIRNGREPFSKILSAVNALGADDQLLLLAPFEPKPLFAVLEKQGFKYKAERAKTGDWSVIFTRPPSELRPRAGRGAPEPVDAPGPSPVAFRVADVDARGLEPPQPLITILEALAALPLGVELRARTDRRPMHLYPQLEERGFAAETEEQTDGSYVTHIRRR